MHKKKCGHLRKRNFAFIRKEMENEKAMKEGVPNVAKKRRQKQGEVPNPFDIGDSEKVPPVPSGKGQGGLDLEELRVGEEERRMMERYDPATLIDSAKVKKCLETLLDLKGVEFAAPAEQTEVS